MNKWRLTMAANKCNVIIFERKTNKNQQIDFKLYGTNIPYCDSTKFLGITLDKHLTFDKHISDIKKKCLDRLNIIKILSCSYWKLSVKTLKQIYLSLIRSIIDYSAFIVPLLSKTRYKTIQAIQNTATRVIYKQPYDATTETLLQISGLDSIKTRADQLNFKYINNCFIFENELLIDLFKEFINYNNKQRTNKTLLCDYKLLIEENLKNI